MPYVELMSWIPRRKGWMKNYRGKRYAVSCRQLGCAATKEASRDAANAWWEATKFDLDSATPAPKPNQREYQEYISIYRRQAQWCSMHLGESPDYQVVMRSATAEADRLQSILDTAKEPPPIGRWERPLANLSDEGRAIWHDRIKHIRQAPKDKTIRYHADRWLEKQQTRARSGEITSDRYSSYKYAIDHVVTWADESSPIDTITTERLEAYQSLLLGEIDKREHGDKQGMTRSYAKERLDVAKQFAYWLYDRDLIPLPKILLNKKALRIKLNASQRTPKIPPIADMRSLLNHAKLPERCRLWLLLMANCGMYQVDVAKLRKDQVDLKAGTITRKRSKTENHANVPTVTFKLWNATRTLLRKHLSDHPTLALTNEDGGPLMRKWIDADGKPQKVSNIDSAYARFRRANKVAIPLGRFRKTSANLLFNRKEYKGLHSLFLGHSTRGMAELAYVVADRHSLDDAVTWLGTQYGV